MTKDKPKYKVVSIVKDTTSNLHPVISEESFMTRTVDVPSLPPGALISFASGKEEGISSLGKKEGQVIFTTLYDETLGQNTSQIYFDVNGNTRLKVSPHADYAEKANTDKLGNSILSTYANKIAMQTVTKNTFPLALFAKDGKELSSINLPLASATKAGILSAEDQEIGGNKTFKGIIHISKEAVAKPLFSSQNPQIKFSENGEQPVSIIYTDYDSYRSPAGLKVAGGSSASPAWFEVEGNFVTGGNILTSTTGKNIGAEGSKWENIYAKKFHGDLIGTAAFATRLETPRKINGVFFDGTEDITITATPTEHNHDKRYIKYNEPLLTTNPFGGKHLYISKIDNAFYAAERRWEITAKEYSKTGSFIRDYGAGSISCLFDGSYESSLSINKDNYVVIDMKFPDESNQYFPGYPYGYIYVSFYHTYTPLEIEAKCYCNYESHGIGWHNLDIEYLSNGESSYIAKIRNGYYAVSEFIFTIKAKSNSNCYPTQIEMNLDRPDSSRTPFVSKYAPEVLYYSLKAPNFIGQLDGTATRALSADSVIWENVLNRPTGVSAFTNDVGYLTKHQSLDNYYKKSETYSRKEVDDSLNTRLAKTGGTMTGDIRFQVAGSEFSSVPLKVYADGTNYGHTLVLGAGGTSYVGAGESPSTLRDNIDVNVTENLYLSADKEIHFYTNCDTIANKKHLFIDTKGDINTNGVIKKFVNNQDFDLLYFGHAEGDHSWKVGYRGSTGGADGNEFYIKSTLNKSYEFDHLGNVDFIDESGKKFKFFSEKNKPTKTDVGLGNVDNTPDATKNVYSAEKLNPGAKINGINFDGTKDITITAAPDEHNHDERYYTESEVDQKLDAKYDKTGGKIDGSISVTGTSTFAGKITGNSSGSFTGDVTAPNFIGALKGDADKALTVKATKGTADLYRNVWFSDSAGIEHLGYSDQFQYNPATDTLKVSNLTGKAASAGKADFVDWEGVQNHPSFSLSGHKHNASDINSGTFDIKQIPKIPVDTKLEGVIPAVHLPSYVDDIIEYEKLDAFPKPGESGKIYVAKDTNKIYRWSGSGYTVISETLSLGETSSTAYPGNKGAANRNDIDDIIDGTIVVKKASRLVNANYSEGITLGSTTQPVYFSSGVPAACTNVLEANIKRYSGSLKTDGWKNLNGKGSGSFITVAYNNEPALWNSNTYSASLVFGTNDTKGLFDCAHSVPRVTFGGGSDGNSTDDDPNWYFKIEGTSGATYDLSNAKFTDDKVLQTVTTGDSWTNWRPIVFGSSNGSGKNFDPSTITNSVYVSKNFKIQPSTGILSATHLDTTSTTYSEKVTIQYNETDESFDFVFK